MFSTFVYFLNVLFQMSLSQNTIRLHLDYHSSDLVFDDSDPDIDGRVNLCQVLEKAHLMYSLSSIFFFT